MSAPKQIDQDPGGYRVQEPNGTWAHRVNKPMARVMAALGAGILVWLGAAFTLEGGSPFIPFVFGVGGACVGAALTMSLKSLNW